MDKKELEELAAQLRKAFYFESGIETGLKEWERLPLYYKKSWIAVAKEAHKWLCG